MDNVLYLKSNVCLVPDHYFSIASEFDVICYGFDPSKSGCKFRTRLSVLTSIPIPNYDLRVCYSPTGGSFANIIKHFPVGSLPDVCFHMIWRAKDGMLLICLEKENRVLLAMGVEIGEVISIITCPTILLRVYVVQF
jgi:hypothetical protein